MELRTFGNFDGDKNSLEFATPGAGIDPDTGEVEVSLTQQQFKEECDINEIVRRFGLTGQLPEVVRIPQSGDFTGITDFKSAMDAVIAAEAKFMELPAAIRQRFGHDPQRLIDFMEDDKNLEEARKLGLVNPPPEKTRDAVTAIDELAAALRGASPAADSKSA